MKYQRQDQENTFWLFVILWTVAHQASLSVGFSRQEYWSGLPFPPPGDLPNSRIEPAFQSQATAHGFFTNSTIWEILDERMDRSNLLSSSAWILYDGFIYFSLSFSNTLIKCEREAEVKILCFSFQPLLYKQNQWTQLTEWLDENRFCGTVNNYLLFGKSCIGMIKNKHWCTLYKLSKSFIDLTNHSWFILMDAERFHFSLFSL